MPKLKIFLSGCTGLKVADITGSSDPYVKIKVGNEKEQKTQVRKRSLNPKWGEVFYFNVDAPATTRVTFSVFDWDRFRKDDPLGECHIELATVPANKDHAMDIPLNTQGTLKCELHLEDTTQAGSVHHAAPTGLAAAPAVIMQQAAQNGPPVITQDPFGVIYYGQPVIPAPAYPGQMMPPAYLFTPPPAFYAPPPEMMANYGQYQFAPVAAAPPPPPFYYGAPVAYELPPYSPAPPTNWAPIVPPSYYDQAPSAIPGAMESSAANGGDEISALPPSMQFAPNTEYRPVDESVANFSDDEHKSTNQPYNGDYWKVSHLNYFSNFLERIEGLRNYPNLMRLTLRENNLKNLFGIAEAPYCRWIDVSNNYLEDFRGMGVMNNLEWLDAHNNNIDNFGGLDWAPNLTYINLHANHMTNLNGANKFQALRWLDLSESDIKTARGLEQCTGLQEINLAANYLEDVDSIKALANLPYLFRINIYYNNFSKKDVTSIVDHFFHVKPQCEVITTKKQAAAVGHNVKWQGKML